MVSWNSVPLHVSYEVLGWFAFACWSISFYPQVILNFRRKRYWLWNEEFINIITDILFYPENSFFYFLTFPPFFFSIFICDLVWWVWTLILWCWIWRSTHPISYTMRLCTSALLFRSSTKTNTVRKRFVSVTIHIQSPYGSSIDGSDASYICH